MRNQTECVVLVLVLLATGCGAPEPATDSGDRLPDEVVEMSVADAQARMAAGTLTSRALTQAYLNRIAAIDDAGPQLNAVIAVNPSAVADADRLDTERRGGRVRGPLHGIPVLIKDNIDVAGLVTSAGSIALAAHRPAADAFLVTRLREAGAVILGKTNLSEWANFRSSRSTSGWSSLGGQTKNPYALDRNPCGSSSGTGAAIAASLATVGVGTETDGSIICPAAVQALVGLKPTVGIVSRRGVVPIAASQDTAGPMARSVADAAAALVAMSGFDRADPAAQAPPSALADLSTVLRADALQGRRLGVLRQAMGYHRGLDEVMSRTIDALRAAGADVVDTTIEGYGRWDDPELEVLLYEFKDGLNKYLNASGAPVPSLAALIEWNQANRERVMPFFGQDLFERAQAKGPLTDAAYLKARDSAKRFAGEEGLLATLLRDRLDAVIAPSTSPAWPTDHVLGDRFMGAGYGAAAVAGTPSLTVPMGEVMGLPVGLTFMGAAFSEATLLGLGYAFEQARKARTPPGFVGTIP